MFLRVQQNGAYWLFIHAILFHRYGVDLIYKKQPLIRGRGVSYCKNLLSPRFEHSEGVPLLSRVLFCTV